jgi:glycosyltransferase involved in cell wall biosynthesis
MIMTVSVVMITYNHEKYIRKAIEGVLSQTCEFEVELIIANDNSPDKSHEIIWDIISLHPNGNWIKYTKHDQNLGPIRNSIWAFRQAKGNYVAICEGDDYWTDPFKLQRQVEFLEKNKLFSMCFHDVSVLNETQDEDYKYPIPSKEKLLFQDILLKHYIPTCSVLYRNSLFPNPIPEWWFKCRMLDLPIELALAAHGPIHYFSEKMAVYRQNNNSLTKNIEQIQTGRNAYNFLYLSLIKSLKGKFLFILFFMYFRNMLGYIKDYIKFR